MYFASLSRESDVVCDVLLDTFERGVVIDGLIADGDNKSFEKIKKVRTYSENFKVKRYECLPHVCKRMKGHLFEYEKESIREAGKEKAKNPVNIPRRLGNNLRLIQILK